MTGYTQAAAAYRAIFRKDGSESALQEVASRIDAGSMTIDDYIQSQLELAATSTIPAFVFAAKFLGVAPSSQYLDGLSDFAGRQYAHYVEMGSAHAQLGPYEALGRAFADTQDFRDQFGRSAFGDDSDFVRTAYQQVFGRAASEFQFSNLRAQVDYFETIYLAAGMGVDDAVVRARGAVYGQMIGYQQTEPGFRNDTVTDEQARAFLTVVAKGDGEAYGNTLETLPVSGREIDTSNAVQFTNSISPDSAYLAARTTEYGDHVVGSIGFAMGLTRGVRSIDSGGGNDVIELSGVAGGGIVRSGSGDDKITILSFEAIGGFSLNVDAGSGNDVIVVGQAGSGDATSPAASGGLIDGGVGNDKLTSYNAMLNVTIKGIETIVLSDFDDVIRLHVSSEALPTSITLGAGRDVLNIEELANLQVSGGSATSFATITDFAKGEDKIHFNGSGKIASVDVSAAQNLDAALAAIGSATAVNTATVFEYAGSTYVFMQDATAALGIGDGLLKLAGVTGLSVGANGDIAFG